MPGSLTFVTSGIETGVVSGVDSGVVSGVDAGAVAGVEAGVDAGVDAGVVSGVELFGSAALFTRVDAVDSSDDESDEPPPHAANRSEAATAPVKNIRFLMMDVPLIARPHSCP